MPADDLLHLLANPVNRSMLAHLAVEPMYTRRMAELVGLSEEETSRRLRAFERLGVLAAEWANVGRTVRLYRLVRSQVVVRLTGEGVGLDGGPAPALPSGAADSGPAPERLVGRALEVETLRTLASERRTVCVHGIGGIGKTALVSAVAASWSGPVVWRTAAPQESASLLLRRLAARLRAVTQSAIPEDEDALAAWIARRASASGSLLVVDRGESAASEAISAFADVAARMDAGAAVLVARTFPSPLPRSFASFQVGGIARDAAHELLRPAGLDATRIDDLHARTGGHPLSLLLARSAAGRLDPAALLRGSGVREFLLEDVLLDLGEAERDALLRLSILEIPFDEAEAGAVSAVARPHDQLLKLAARGLVVRLPDGWLVHDLVRAALAEDAPAGAHRLAAQAFLAHGDPARAIEALRHALLAGDVRLAERVVEQEATERAYRFAEYGLGAPYAAILHQVEHAASSPKLRAASLLELASLAGRDGGDAAPLLARARPFVPPTGPLRARLRLEEAFEAQRKGDFASTLGHLEAAAADRSSPRLTADALFERAILVEELDAPHASAAFDEALAAAEGTDDPRLLSLAYAGAARARLRAGEDARPLAEEALRLARLSGHLRGEAMAHTTLTEGSLDPSKGEEASREGLRHARHTVEIARRLGDPWMLACSLGDQAILAARVGEYDEASASGIEGLEAAQRVGSLYLRLGAQTALCDVGVARGDAERARRELAAAIAEFEATATHAPPPFALAWWALSRAEEACGNATAASEARARALALWPPPGAPVSGRPAGGATPSRRG